MENGPINWNGSVNPPVHNGVPRAVFGGGLGAFGGIGPMRVKASERPVASEPRRAITFKDGEACQIAEAAGGAFTLKAELLISRSAAAPVNRGLQVWLLRGTFEVAG